MMCANATSTTGIIVNKIQYCERLGKDCFSPTKTHEVGAKKAKVNNANLREVSCVFVGKAQTPFC